MAYENPILFKSWEAASDLSAKQFLAVKLNGSGKLAVCGAGESSIGPLQNKPTSGQFGDVMVDGLSRGISGAAYSEMDALAADSAGKYVKATPGTVAIAIAFEAATAGDQTKAIQVIPAAGAGGPPSLTLSAGTEAANIIKVTAQLKTPNGVNVAVATKVRVTAYDSGATLTDGGSGTMEFGSTTVEGMFTTSATGELVVDVTDTAAESVAVEFLPEKGVPTFITLVFA